MLFFLLKCEQLMQNCGISLFFIIGNFIPWRLLTVVGMILFRDCNLKYIFLNDRCNVIRTGQFNMMFVCLQDWCHVCSTSFVYFSSPNLQDGW